MVSASQVQNFSIVPEKKVSEVRSWFEEHFKKSDHREYLSRSPFVIFFGPTGCGKTTSLERIAEEFDLSIKEYSETTDTSLIQFELKNFQSDREGENTTLRIDRHKSHIFESFVINHLRYAPLYSDNRPIDEEEQDAADEFDDDDDFIVQALMSSNPEIVKSKPPQPKGIIIHIESPLTFGKTTTVLIQCLRRLKKVIKEVSQQCPRRVAIVFEAVDGNDHVMSLSASVRQSLDINVFKFNPVTRVNMKKFIEFELRDHNYLDLDKETLDQLIDDSDGDASACKNTLRLMRGHECSCRPVVEYQKTKGHYQYDAGEFLSRFTPSTPAKVNKKQKTEHDRVRKLIIHPKLMRDITKGSGFFHILGKIFYQKRYYPDNNCQRPLRCIDRPYITENSTEHLVNQVDSESKKLNAWLHQNYAKFCPNNDIEKAALFLDNLSFVDTMSLDSTQSTQYYENHKFIDLMQKHLAIESTVYSLYSDNSSTKKSGDKKITTKDGRKMILRSSVDTNNQMKIDLHYQGFSKPTSLIISKVSGDHQALLDRFSSKMSRIFQRPYEQSDLLLDYAPYVKILLDRSAISISGDDHLHTMIRELQRIDDPLQVDYDEKHENLLELIDRCDSQKVREEPRDVLMED